MEAGLDSLGAVDLRNTLSARFSLELPSTFAIDYPSVVAMADHIAGSIAAAEGQAEPHWRKNALLQKDFGDATSAAAHVVGMSCVYPGG
jgi:hypothetical protein